MWCDFCWVETCPARVAQLAYLTSAQIRDAPKSRVARGAGNERSAQPPHILSRRGRRLSGSTPSVGSMFMSLHHRKRERGIAVDTGCTACPLRRPSSQTDFSSVAVRRPSWCEPLQSVGSAHTGATPSERNPSRRLPTGSGRGCPGWQDPATPRRPAALLVTAHWSATVAISRWLPSDVIRQPGVRFLVGAVL
jgi:hypothetical protein